VRERSTKNPRILKFDMDTIIRQINLRGINIVVGEN